MSELDITVSLVDRDKGNREYGGSPTSKSTTGNANSGTLFEVGTSEESFAFHADVTGGEGPGYCYVKNHDDTNFVEIGTATGVYWARLDAGDEMLVPLNASGADTLYLKADTAACEVEIYCQER